MRRNTIATVQLVSVCALAGLVAAGGWWWMRPKRFVSTTVLRPQTWDAQAVSTAVHNALGDYSLASIIEQLGLYPEERKRSMGSAIRKMRDEAIQVQEAESLGPVVVIRFHYAEAKRAQAAARDLASAIQATGLNCEVLEEASLPLNSEAGPAKPLTAGFAGGLLLGIAIAAAWRTKRVRP